jgi:hypothetical protein
MNAAEQFCRAALFMVNLQRIVAVLPQLVRLFAQKGRDFDLVIEFIAKQWLCLRDRAGVDLWALVPFFLTRSWLWTSKDVEAIKTTAAAGCFALWAMLLNLSGALLMHGLFAAR